MRSDGKVDCGFIAATSGDGPRCPHAARSLQFAADYRFDNRMWLNDFQSVYKKMLTNGYNRVGCNNAICSLFPRV
jgi:hypothetical protein